MRIRVKRQFTYTLDHVKDLALMPGEYEVPRNVSKEVAELAISFGAAVIIPQMGFIPRKRAPKNKMAMPPENKTAEAPEAA